MRTCVNCIAHCGAVGTAWYNDPSSAVGAPTLNLPLLEVEGAPLGVQLMGFEQEDYALVAMARWILSTQLATPSVRASLPGSP